MNGTKARKSFEDLTGFVEKAVKSIRKDLWTFNEMLRRLHKICNFDVTEEWLQDVEDGKHTLSFEEFTTVCTALGLSPEDVLVRATAIKNGI